MTVFQHYFTAWYDSARGSAGQQTKAQSPAIPFNLESDPTWMAMKEYALPPGITDRDVEHHPVALRYFPMRPDLVLLVHYTSTGTGADDERTDNEIRYGNMFVHTLVMSPQDFVRGDPIQYWGSPFWQSEDATPSRHDLAEMHTLDLAPTLALPQVISFIQRQPAGWDKLTSLLSAVIGNARSPRPVLIVGEPDAVAHWIAGVSFLLPPPYRPLLSFSTYSHAYPSRYMMTGLHPAQFARLRVAQDYRDYFVLGGDPDDGESHIEPDPYAQFATQCLREDTYESALRPLFQIASQRFSAPKTVADNLGALLSTRTLFASNRTTQYTADEVTALSAFVRAESAATATGDSDLESLRSLHTICLRAVTRNLAPVPFEPYQEIVGALMRRDAAQWAQELVVDLCAALDLLEHNATQRPQAIANAVNHACQLPEQTTALAQQPQWAQKLTTCSSVSLPAHLRIWALFGRYITPQTVPTAWLQATMKAAFGNASGGDIREQENLESLLFQNCSPYALEWATRIGELRGQLDLSTTAYAEQFYYECLVRDIWPPSERTPVRKIFREVAPNVSDTEAYEDLRKRAGDNGRDVGDVLELWFSMASQAPVRWTVVLERLALLSQASVSLVPRTVAAALLARIDELTRIESGNAAAYLADTVIINIPFWRMSHDEELVCWAWRRDTRLTPQSRDYASAIIEARKGHATASSLRLLRSTFMVGLVKPEEYRQRCEEYLWQRFVSGGASVSHISDIQVLYMHVWSDVFWKAYWSIFDRALFDPAREDMLIAFLEFWFERAQSVLGPTEYKEFLQQFASHLNVCAAIRKSELSAVYNRLEKRNPEPRWLTAVLRSMDEAINKRRLIPGFVLKLLQG